MSIEPDKHGELSDILLNSAEEPLDGLLSWISGRGIELYPAQEEAILEIFQDNHVILNTPTGSGKSLVALAMHARALSVGARSMYTSPIRALVSEKFFDLCETFGAERVGMMIGNTAINPTAPIMCCTAEVLANMVLRRGAETDIDYVIMDEFHYFSDRDRGWAWQAPLLELKDSVFMLMSATLGDTSDLRIYLERFTNRDVSVVRSNKRPVPLSFTWKEDPIHEVADELLSQNKAPVYVVNFSQREATEQAQHFTSIALLSREDRAKMRAEVGRFRFDSPFGKTVSRLINHGVGVHHAGLLPRYRLLIERLAQKGLLRIISGTDTLGVGVNVPIRTVLFSKLCKYDGEKTAILSVRDFHQIAGRAGRKGFDDQGFVVAQAPEHVIQNMRLEAKAAASRSGRKRFVRAQPPKRGYVPWNKDTFDNLIHGRPEPLKGNFRIDHGMVLYMLQRELPDSHPGGYADLVGLVSRTFYSDRDKSRLRRQGRACFRALLAAGLVELIPREGRSGRRAQADPSLQANFALDQALSLFFLQTLPLLEDAAQTGEELAMLILSLAEAIEPNPMPILIQQQWRERNLAREQMKAEGLDYEERGEKLQEIFWPKPNEQLFDELFEAFTSKWPWLKDAKLRPKGIATEIVSSHLSFNDYVRSLGIERMEGTLLRYLAQIYRTLARTVPISYLNDELVDVISFLHATIERTDSSLLQHWEALLAGADAPTEQEEAEVEYDISQDKRAFNSRIRTEVHMLVRALHLQDWEDALGWIADDPDDPWTAERLASLMSMFLEEKGELIFNHAARLATRTNIREIEPKLWRVRYTLLDPDDTGDWLIDALVDLRKDTAPKGPLLKLLAIEG